MTTPTSVTLLPCLSIGNAIIAPELEIAGDLYRCSLMADSLKGAKGQGLRRAFGIDEADLRLTLLDVVGVLEANPDADIAALLDARLDGFDLSYDAKTGTMGFQAKVEAGAGSLAMAVLSAPGGAPNKDNAGTGTPGDFTAKGRTTLVDVAVGGEISLAELMPLVNPDDLPRFEMGAHLIYSSRALKSEEVDDLLEVGRGHDQAVKDSPGTNGKAHGQGQMPTESLGFLEKAASGLPQGLSVVPCLRIGDGAPILLQFPLGSEKEAKGSGNSSADTADVAAPEAASPKKAATPSGRQLGPFRIDGFKPGFENGALILSVDGALQLSGMELALMGLKLELELAKLVKLDITGLGFGLDGLSLSLEQGGLSLSGAFLRMEIEEKGKGKDKSKIREEYAGQFRLDTGRFAITGLGAYSRLPSGEDSLFIYAALNAPLGGIPEFFIEGIALGFGYNRGVSLPPVEKVNEFPLVSALDDGESPGGAQNDAPGANSLVLLREKMTALSQYLPATPGQYLIAAGIRFNTYKQITSIAVLMVEFGERFAIHVAGLSRMELPPRETGAPTVASLEMAYRVSFVPDDGVIGVEAQLTGNSFVISRQCRLTGGFAFYSWFAGEHAGDFVVSMGGYHPRFNKPAHYPVVPRLGFYWQVTNELSFRGEMYAALTPIAIMAGGRFDAVFKTGPVEASYSTGLDFIIYWQPFYYDARFYISISASCDLWLCTVSAEMGADLHIWGPEFAGSARIDWSVFSFDIEFGSGGQGSNPISWEQFRQGYLPKKSTEFSQIAITKGERERKEKDGKKGKEAWHLVEPDEFELRIDSQIPIGTLRAERMPDEGKKKAIPCIAVEETGGAFHVAPMGGKPVADWEMEITIVGDGAEFIVEGIEKNHPIALWGPDFRPNIQGGERTIPLLSGALIRPGPGKPPGFTEPVDADAFTFQDIVERDPYWQWGRALGGSVDADALEEDNRKRIRDTLQDSEVKDRRKEIALWFGIEGEEISLEEMRQSLDSAFIGVPQIFAADRQVTER